MRSSSSALLLLLLLAAVLQPLHAEEDKDDDDDDVQEYADTTDGPADAAADVADTSDAPADAADALAEELDDTDRLLLLLARIDKDDDDLLTKDELNRFVKRSHNLVPNDIALELFEVSDSNGDGSISWDEHLKGTFDVHDPEDIPGQLEGPYEHKMVTMKKIRSDETLFEAADTDDDGDLDKDEYAAFSMPENSDALVPLLLQHSIGGRDQDGDGVLTFEEFSYDEDTYHHIRPSQKWTESRFNEFLDHNGDGVLDQREMQRYAMPRNLNAVLEEVEHMFEEADEDNDEHLTFDEVLRYKDLFVHSPVTGYGDHIKNIHQLREEL